MKINDLKPADYNPRKITDEQLERLKKSMQEFGDLSGIVKNVRTGNMIGGHQRVKCFDPSWEIKSKKQTDKTGTVAAGHVETPWGPWVYREVDWDERKEKAANIAANKHGGMWDMPKLAEIIVELDDGEFDMDLTGFGAFDLAAIRLPGGDDDDDAGDNDDIVPDKDQNIIVRLSFHPGMWLGKREEIMGVFEKLEKSYSCDIKVDE